MGENDNIFETPFDGIINEKGLGFELYNCMRKYRRLIAQYIVDTEEEETYADILKRSIRTAIHLQKRGITRNDVVILSSYNQKYSCVPFIACLFLGIPVASLDPILSVMDIKHLMKEVSPKIVFIVEMAYESIKISLEEAGIDAEIVVYGEHENCTPFAEFLEPVSGEDKFTPTPIDCMDTAVIVFSSGTTGLPKGIMLNHSTIHGQSINIANSGNMGPVILTYASLYWISAILVLVVCAITGAARVVSLRFIPNTVWTMIETYRITSIFLAPPHAVEMIKVGRPDGLDTTSLWTLYLGGGSMSQRLIEEVRDLLPGTFVVQIYGQSEVGGTLTTFKTNDVKQTRLLYYKPKSVGVPIPGFTFKVVDPETERICGPDEHGELRVKSQFMMTGYYNRDAAESFDAEGWLRTGDIVYYDEDHCFYVVDRIKEMLKYKSWHVPPAMIEQVLVAHPAVRAAVVIGIPHEEDGDHPMGLVILTDGHDAEQCKKDIENFVADRVPDRMQLRAGVKVVDRFPMTPSGKFKRKLLKEMVLAGQI